MSALIWLAIVVVWGFVLIPMWLRHHDSTVEQRSADRFAVAMRVLSRHSPRDDDDEDEDSANEPAAERDDARPASGAWTATSAGANPRARDDGPPAGPPPGRAKPVNRALMRIRRQRLYVLIGALPVTILLAALLGGTWYIVQAIEDVGLFVYLAHLRSVVRTQREPAGRTGRPATGAQARAARPAPRSSGAAAPARAGRSGLTGAESGRPSVTVGAGPARRAESGRAGAGADGDGDGDGEGEGDLALAEAETVDLRDIAAVAADRIAAAAAGDGAGLDGRPLALPPAQGHADEVAADRTRAVVEGHPPAESHAVAESYGAGKTHGAAEYYGAGGYDEDYDDEDYDDAEEYGAGGHGATGYGAAGYGAAGYAAHGYDAHGHDGTGHGTDGYGGADGDGIGEYADGIEARGEPGAVADVGHGWSDADSDFGDEDERPFRSSGRPTARPPGGRPTTSRPGRVQVNPPGSHGGLTAGPRVSAPSSSVPPASQPASQPAPAVGPDDGEDVDGYTHRRAVGS